MILIFSFVIIGCNVEEIPVDKGKIFEKEIINFEECVEAGNPIMESYPRQCRTAYGRNFVEQIGMPFEETWQDSENADEPQPDAETQEIRKRGLLSPQECIVQGPEKLGASPLALDDLLKIAPMGAMSTSHITPTDHQYWHTVGYFGSQDDTENLDRFNVFAPADGFIINVEKGVDHRVVIEHSCSLYTIFIHVDRLSERIKSHLNFKEDSSYEYAWPKIPVEEGETIGTIGVGKLDFSVVDAGVILEGFISPELYEGEPWKIHTVDTFDYYDEPLRSQLLAKNLRKSEPLGGKIDYDVDGKLIGNWFVENTQGYRGLESQNYWSTHLSIAYDALDTKQVVVSIGDFYEGRGDQFGVKGNLPNPKDVSVETGAVKYELVPYDHYSGGKKWDGIDYADNIEARNSGEVRGVALFELMDERRLKAEFFPNKEGSQVSGFTGNALFYER